MVVVLQNVEEWPACGGANGSIRFDKELAHGANAGLVNSFKLLEPIKKEHPDVSYADLLQMASAVAVEVRIAWKMLPLIWWLLVGLDPWYHPTPVCLMRALS